MRWLLCAGALALAASCASTVIAPSDRAVVVESAELDLQPWAGAVDLPGLYESIDIRGEASSQFWKIYYLFEGGGRYAAAALVTAALGLEFQTQNGTWAASPNGLTLDGDTAIDVTVAPGHLRLGSPGGTVVLRAVVLR
jgi:hypothetical protein